MPVIMLITIMARSGKKAMKLVAGSIAVVLAGIIVVVRMKFYPILPYYENFVRFSVGQKSFSDYIAGFDQRMPRNYDVARYIKTRTDEADNIYIWGTQPDIYVMEDRLPVGPLTVSFHVEDLKAYDETMDWLKASPPKYIVMMADEPKEFRELKDWIEAQYMFVAEIKEAKIWQYRAFL